MSVERPREIEERRAERGAKKVKEEWIIVVVVLTVSLVLMTTSLYFLRRGGGCCTTTAEPHIQLSEDIMGPGRINVAGVSRAEDLGSFQAVLLKNGTNDGRAMNPLREATVDQITFTDLNGDEKLSTGDYFTIDMVPDSSYKLAVIWLESGNVRASQEWET